MIRWTHGLINRLVRVVDGAMLAAATAAAGISFGYPTVPQTALLGVLGIALFVQCVTLSGGYRVERYRSGWSQVGDLAIGLVPAAVAVACAFHAFLPDPVGGIGWVGCWTLLAVAAVVVGRFGLVRWGLVLVDRRRLLRRNVAIVGLRDRIAATLPQFGRSPDDLFDLVGIFVDEAEAEPPPSIGGVPVRGRVGDLFSFVHTTPVDVIVVALPWESTVRINAMVERLHRIAADVIVPLDKDSFNPRFAAFAVVAGVPSLKVQYQPLKGSLGLLKRLEDVTVAAVALVLTAPLLLVAALAIKLDSRGPVVFRQQRVGFNNKPFTIYKLRTFAVDPTDDGSLGTRRNDARVTRVGSVLRRLSIDELPQLVNVLRGEMSIVGPRPHVPNMQVSGRQYYELVRDYAARYRVKPGITGWGQINGMRGGIDTVEKAARGVTLDLHYIENWSIWFDLRIMVVTVVRGLAGRDVF